MDQKAINLNVQQRLRALEAQMQVLVPFALHSSRHTRIATACASALLFTPKR